MRAKDPLLDQAYKLLVGPQMAARIEDILMNVKEQDKDIREEEIKHLILTIPQLGTSEEIRKFTEDWEAGVEFIDIDNLIPPNGMNEAQPLDSVIIDGIPKKLFQNLTRAGMFSKGDAGPAEIALAIMSRSISFPEDKGGDIIIGDAKIEVKSGGKERKDQGGGRIWGKEKVNQQPMIDFITEQGITLSGAGLSVIEANNPKFWQKGAKKFQYADGREEDFPRQEFAKIISNAWFGKTYQGLVNKFGTNKFAKEWYIRVYNQYKQFGGHTGILIIGATQFKYIINGSQLFDSDRSAHGYVYYPGSFQGRDLHPQVTLT